MSKRISYTGNVDFVQTGPYGDEPWLPSQQPIDGFPVDALYVASTGPKIGYPSQYQDDHSDDGGSYGFHGGYHQQQYADSADWEYSGEEQQRKLAYRSQNADGAWSADRSAGLANKMVEKIAAIEKIAAEHDVAGYTTELDGALKVYQKPIRISDKHFVTFYNATMNKLNKGQLRYMAIDPHADVIRAQIYFPDLETTGSFVSNLPQSRSGYFAIAMNDAYINFTTGFSNAAAARHSAIVRPALYRYADATVKTVDGAETHAFDDALKHRYLRDLAMAASAEALMYADRGMIAQMKTEIRQPAVYSGAEVAGKLYDMRWTEDHVTMEMSGIGNQVAAAGGGSYGRQHQQQYPSVDAVHFYQKPGDGGSYAMRYRFGLAGLRWTSGLSVQTASGKRMATVRPAEFAAENIDFTVTVYTAGAAGFAGHFNKYQQQQPCAGRLFDVDVTVRGLRYDIDDDQPSELVAVVQAKLQSFIEHSLEAYFQKSLEREICTYTFTARKW